MMETITALLVALPALIAAASAVANWVQAGRAKDTRRALEMSDDTLLAIVAALQAVDPDGRLKPTKDAIRAAAVALGTEEGKLGPLVDQVRAMLKSDPRQDTLTTQKAVEAARAAREASHE